MKLCSSTVFRKHRIRDIRAKVVSELPLEFEAWAYRVINPAVAALNDEDAFKHYELSGKESGIRCHQVHDRNAFIALVPPNQKTLEIGPFAKPSVVGPTVKYADIRSTKELRELALVTEGMNPEDVPKINWVVPSCDLSVINEKFDAVISSHCIEHQPDLIKHLNQVENLLEADGRYFLLIPDHRYCFDHFKVPSSISDVLTASLEKRSTHSVLHRLNSQLFNAHNNPIKHWNGNHEGQEFDTEFPSLNRLQQIKKVVREYQEEGERIKDEHAWFFTPSTFTSIINELNDLEILNLKIERIYPTLRNSNEYWVVLRT